MVQAFKEVRIPARKILTSPKPAAIQNTFEAVNDTTSVVVGDVECVVQGDSGGCLAPEEHGKVCNLECEGDQQFSQTIGY